MKYVIMCGGKYPKWNVPRQLLKINGEVIVERTIRLLKENGVEDIAISTNDDRFRYLDVEILSNDNDKFVSYGDKEVKESAYSWLNAYYPLNEEVCYLHGDVYFSEDAIRKIVNTKVKDTMFFCVPDKNDVPYKSIRNKKGREPIAYKVVNYKKFRNAVDDLLRMIDEGKFKNAKCSPIAWTVYRYLNGLDIGYNAQGYGDLNSIFDKEGDYTIINDYTTDVDSERDIDIIEKCLEIGGINMIKVEVIEEFTYGNFNSIKNSLVRKAREKEGWLFKGDTFECDEDTVKYLTGSNPLNKTVVKVIEVIPEAVIEEKPVDPQENEEEVVTKVEFLKEAKPSMKIKKNKNKK